MKKAFLITVLFAALGAIGCEDKADYVVVEEIVVDEDVAPPVPQGVYSITRDEEVLLYWLPVDDVNNDLATYIVYRSNHPDTGYLEIGRTAGEYFVDHGVINGYTYYFAVSSVDVDGNLSDLSYETVFDTPRPQGANRTLFDLNVMPAYSGWDLSAEVPVDYRDVGFCDFFLEYYDGDGVFYFNVGNSQTDIQDMGYTETLDDIGYAPESGWSLNGWCEVILGHTYVIWTDDNHFAKVRVTAINSENILFDWAYQVAGGNPELKPLIKRAPDYLRHPLGAGSATGNEENSDLRGM